MQNTELIILIYTFFNPVLINTVFPIPLGIEICFLTLTSAQTKLLSRLSRSGVEHLQGHKKELSKKLSNI